MLFHFVSFFIDNKLTMKYFFSIFLKSEIFRHKEKEKEKKLLANLRDYWDNKKTTKKNNDAKTEYFLKDIFYVIQQKKYFNSKKDENFSEKI